VAFHRRLQRAAADTICRGLEIYTPFANLPSRKLEDYYKFIQHPVALKKVAKQVRGIQGRNEPTGVTIFKTWDAFEEEVSFIWRNAKDYNEDGSDMYLLANDFEVCGVKLMLLFVSLTAHRSTSSHCSKMPEPKSRNHLVRRLSLEDPSRKSHSISRNSIALRPHQTPSR